MGDPFLEIYRLYGTSSHLLFEEENVLDYRPGGYHPVVLGDTLKAGRYTIHHKLGYGGFSTVWVARDSKLDRWVSVKIATADGKNQSRELQSLRALKQLSKGDLGSECIVPLLDEFLHKGPNGCHQCLVFELLGPTVNFTVDASFEVGGRLDTESILKMSTQLLRAVAFMHKAGYAHGDLSVKNLAFNTGCLSRLPEKELFEILGLPDWDDLDRVDGRPLGKGVPAQLIKSVQWVGWPEDDDEDDEDVRVIDFGEAFPHNAVPERLAQPAGLQAPETIFTDSFDYRVDLWRAGLMIYYFAFGILPFYWFSLDGLVASMIHFVGELPLEWQPKWEEIQVSAGIDLKLREELQQEFSMLPKLEQTFDEKIDDPELKVLLPVIKELTRFLPSERISASQALGLIEGQVEADG